MVTDRLTLPYRNLCLICSCLGFSVHILDLFLTLSLVYELYILPFSKEAFLFLLIEINYIWGFEQQLTWYILCLCYCQHRCFEQCAVEELSVVCFLSPWLSSSYWMLPILLSLSVSFEYFHINLLFLSVVGNSCLHYYLISLHNTFCWAHTYAA